MVFFDFGIFRFSCFWISGILEFWSFGSFGVWDFLICVVFFCCFVCCLFGLLCFWYTFVVSNVFLRVPKTESDFRCTEKAEFADY